MSTPAISFNGLSEKLKDKTSSSISWAFKESCSLCFSYFSQRDKSSGSIRLKAFWNLLWFFIWSIFVVKWIWLFEELEVK